jgi:rhamnogalacturonan endolyase
MSDPIYRLSVAYQNVGYNQPTQTGFYLGDSMSQPPRPAIVTRNSGLGL